MEEIILYLKSKKRLLSIIFLALAFIALIIYPLIWLKNQPEKKKTKISVEVAGAVNKPGLFTLDANARVADAISLAGGFTHDADQDFINSTLNQARQIEDGEKILIPTTQEAASQTTTASTNTTSTTTSPSSKKTVATQSININEAALSELETLPGIGAAYAQRIIDYRNANAGFKSIDQIQNVKGIGPKTFEKLKDLITI